MEVLAYPLLVVIIVGLIAREVIAPLSQNICDRRWLYAASGIGLLQMVIAISLGFYFRDWFLDHAIFVLDEELPSFVIALIAFLITSFILYWWHRAVHKSDTLWRFVHQLHHSPHRVETITSFFAHPLDSAVSTLVSCFSAYLIVGANAETAAWVMLYTGVINAYIHSDTRSPYWLGFIIPRPEMHRVHHKRNSHSLNYGLPIWDMLFGTYCNPKTDNFKLGFPENKRARIYDMLRFVDVYKK